MYDAVFGCRNVMDMVEPAKKMMNRKELRDYQFKCKKKGIGKDGRHKRDMPILDGVV